MRVLKASLLYFSLVFAAGFVLGIVRTFWVLPHVGERKAKLMEMPIMFVVIVLAAQRSCGFLSPSGPASRLAVGLLALGFLLMTEIALVPWPRRLTIREYLANLDPVPEMAYAVMLVVFSVMPVFTS
jgi:hypothetical protein